MKEDIVRKIAILSRIKISDGEIDNISNELSSILDWIKLLQEVDTESIEPMTGGTDIKMLWRKDSVNDGSYSEKILINAPSENDNLFEVPKVVE
jgi:aspartyl-tRNA(Asn)/glutamyl-tRNA(Gln) amidotransferase subunit C